MEKIDENLGNKWENVLFINIKFNNGFSKIDFFF